MKNVVLALLILFAPIYMGVTFIKTADVIKSTKMELSFALRNTTFYLLP